MKRYVEPTLIGLTAASLILFLIGYSQLEIIFAVSVILLAAYYATCSVAGAITGTLDPVFNKEINVISSARAIYLVSGLSIVLACITLFMRYAENYEALFLPIASAALLVIALCSIDALFHKTSDRRHLPMLYRLGIFSAVIVISCWIHI